jgi:hypothetical protein
MDAIEPEGATLDLVSGALADPVRRESLSGTLRSQPKRLPARARAAVVSSRP